MVFFSGGAGYARRAEKQATGGWQQINIAGMWPVVGVIRKAMAPALMRVRFGNNVAVRKKRFCRRRPIIEQRNQALSAEANAS